MAASSWATFVHKGDLSSPNGPVERPGPSRAILCQFLWRAGNGTGDGSLGWQTLSGMIGPTLWIGLSCLNRVLTIRRRGRGCSWKRLKKYGQTISATWVDGRGETHVVAIDRAFLDAHAKSCAPLMLNLKACGADGVTGDPGRCGAPVEPAQGGLGGLDRHPFDPITHHPTPDTPTPCHRPIADRQ